MRRKGHTTTEHGINNSAADLHNFLIIQKSRRRREGVHLYACNCMWHGMNVSRSLTGALCVGAGHGRREADLPGGAGRAGRAQLRAAERGNARVVYPAQPHALLSHIVLCVGHQRLRRLRPLFGPPLPHRNWPHAAPARPLLLCALLQLHSLDYA